MNQLDQLRDIHLPDSIQWWPLAIGWWVLAGSLLILAFGVWRRFKGAKRQRRTVNFAIKSLEQLEVDTDLNPQEWLQALSALLRRIVINLYGRKAAGLVGSQWLEYLDLHLKSDNFSKGVGKLLATQPYQEAPSYDRKELSGLVRQWVKKQASQSASKKPINSNRQREMGVDNA